MNDKTTRYWLNMKSAVRTPDDWLDLNKCEAVCTELFGDQPN